LSFNAFIKEKISKVILTYAILMIFYKLLYNKSWNKSIIGSFLIYLITMLSEIITVPLILVIMGEQSLDIIQEEAPMIVLINFLIGIVDLLLYKIFKKRIFKIVEASERINLPQSIIIYSILLITASMIINKLSVTSWMMNWELVVNIIIFIVFLTILLYMSRQTQKYDKIRDKYSQLSEYTKINDELLEEYRMKSHEFNNQLAIVKSMTEEDNKDLQEYLDTLIKKTRKNKYSWVNEVKYIQLAGLKGLLNYKIIEMKNSEINLYLNISKEVKKFDFNKFQIKSKDHLYSIVGVFLDNAREASLNSIDKEVAIEIYMESRKMIITIGNTYSEKINLDKIGEYNYTTKGKGHGVGLHLVKNIVKNDNKFSTKTEIRGKYFVQILTIIP